jgi:hypothetical protein
MKVGEALISRTRYKVVLLDNDIFRHFFILWAIKICYKEK